MRKIIFSLALAILLSTGSAFAANKININTATQSELAAYPVIGPELAEKITEYIQNVSDFASYDDLKEIDGVTDTKIKEMAQFLSLKV